MTDDQKTVTEANMTALIIDSTNKATIEATDNCLSDVETCGPTGVTFRTSMKFTSLLENSCIMSTDGDAEDEEGYGIHMVYRYNKFQYRMATTTAVYYTESKAFEMDQWTSLSVSFQATKGLEIWVDDTIVARTTEAINRTASATSRNNNIVIGCSDTSTSTTQTSTFQVGSFNVYFASMDLLIESGKLGKLFSYILS